MHISRTGRGRRARERGSHCNGCPFAREDKVGSISRYLFASFALALFVAFGSASAQGPTVSIETDYLMTLEGICEPGQPMGQRLVVNCTGGSAHGPKINATVIPPTGDWLIPVTEGLLRLDVRGTLKTDDGELIFFEYGGVISGSKEAGDRLAKGEVLTAKDVYFMTAPKFSTSSKKYDWLNHIQAVGKMTSVQAGKFVKYDVFTVR
jgi:hypothetical protein